jgi:leader peptidase (prepilin peptidase)/N-methyltransferase
LVGLCVGSFLNVAIHRLPREGQSVSRPRRSYCPKCRHELSWRENVPMLSWLIQGGRCRWCRQGISWRYPLVEALTASLWAGTAWLAPSGAWPLVLVQCLVLSGLVVATFVDFDFYEIPDEVSIGGMVIAPLASLLVPSLHASTWISREMSGAGAIERGPALVASLAGLLAGGGALYVLGWLGRRIYGREAMGLGDVKLLAAGGGFVGPGGALAALLLGAAIASAVGLLNLVRFYWLIRLRARARGVPKGIGRTLKSARVAGRYLPFGPYLGIGIGITLVAWNHVVELLGELAS